MKNFSRFMLLPVICSLLAQTGCSSATYRYDAPGNGGRYVAAENLKGSIQLVALGPVDISSSHIRVMHLQMVLSNAGNEKAWTVIPSEELLFLPTRGSKQPAYVEAGTPFGYLASISVAPGEKKSIDLFYALPENMSDASDIPRFSVDWRVHRGTQSVEKITVFDRKKLS
jgi:hypothetical protein